MKPLKILVVFAFLAAIGGTAFIWSGAYNVSATEPHWEITHKVLEVVRERSVASHSKGITPPPLDDRKLKEIGFREFQEMCVRCHGAPGYQREAFAMGLYPGPPDLASGDLLKEMKAAEIFWIVKNGFKMTGMPSFGAWHDDDELWGIVAFMEGLHRLTPQEYKGMVETVAEVPEEEEHRHGGHRHE